MAVPLKLTPPIFLAVSKDVAVAALPVQDPDEPDALPVKLPEKVPEVVPAIVVLPELSNVMHVVPSSSFISLPATVIIPPKYEFPLAILKAQALVMVWFVCAIGCPFI